MDKLTESLLQSWKLMEGAGFDSEVAADYDPTHVSQKQMGAAKSFINAINNAHKKNIITKVHFDDGSTFELHKLAQHANEFNKMIADAGMDAAKGKARITIGDKTYPISLSVLSHIVKNIDKSTSPKSEFELLAQEVLSSADIGAYESFGAYAFDVLKGLTTQNDVYDDQLRQKVAALASKKGGAVEEMALQLAYAGWKNHKKVQ